MKKQKLYGLEITIDVYDTNISVLCGDKDLAIKYCEKYGCVFDEFVKNKNVDGFCVRNESFKNYVFFNDYANKDVLVHEMTHALLNMTYTRNIVIDDRPENQESTCYLFGYAIGKVLNQPKRKWYVYNPKKKVWEKQK